jgi:protocatechuate 3,4-dioxygenase beta subunit
MTDENTPPRLINRRRTLSLFGAAGVAGLAAAVGCSSSNEDKSTATATRSATATSGASATGVATATGAVTATAAATATPGASVAVNCVAVPELTEGPYFVDELLNRSDIRPDPTNGAVSTGVPLVMTIKVYDSSCSPLAGADVDLWHCDADGKYSDVSQNGTAGQKFLRGYQTTDSDGVARFTTVYPGWYQGRAVHIHFKIRNYDGSSTAGFISQFFFDEDVTDQVYQQAPYGSRGERDLRNESDGIFGQSGGATLLTPTPSGDGYETAFGVMLQA